MGILGIIFNSKKKKREIEERVAGEILSDFDFEKEKKEILSLTEGVVDRNLLCPDCDGILVLRNGKYGQFFGCNNYPICKFSKNKK